jgi:hypothetical protein
MRRETTTPDFHSVSITPSRRALLAGALAGIGAAATRAFSSPFAARAAGDDGATVTVGATLDDVQATTSLGNVTNAAPVLALNSTSGVPLTTETGADGSAAITARAPSGGGGIAGVAGNHGTGTFRHVGVFGFADGGAPAQPRGVWGKATTGWGVYGEAPQGVGTVGKTINGVGLWGIGGTGLALKADGRVRFERSSGVATIPAGSMQRTIDPGLNITSGSFVLLTPKVNLGGRSLWFTTNPRQTFTIHISSPRSFDTRIAWFLVG